MINKYIKHIVALLAAILSTCSFGLSYYWEDVSSNGARVLWHRHIDHIWNQAQTEPFNNIFFLSLFGALCYVYFKTIEIVRGKKRLIVFALSLSALFAAFEVVGHSFAAVSGLNELFYSSKDFIKSVLRWCGYTPIFFSSIIFITHIIIPKIETIKISTEGFPSNKKNDFLIIAGGCLIVYTSFIVKYWPMVFNYDTLSYISEAFYPPLTNHHSVFNAWILVPFIKIGLLIGDACIENLSGTDGSP